MRDWAIWYRNLVIAWFLIALPGIVIGYGMAGGDVGIPGRDADLLSVLIWLLCVGFLFSPPILAGEEKGQEAWLRLERARKALLQLGDRHALD
jgi:hypothetical protein